MPGGRVSPDPVCEDAHWHVRPVPCPEHTLDSCGAAPGADYCDRLVTLTALAGAIVLKMLK